MGEIVLREFEERDWKDVARFYEEFYRPSYVFAQRRFFDWNFFSPLRPDGRCGQRLLLDGGKIIGIMGALAWPLQARGEHAMGEYNVNLYLDPAYRGQRLGQRLLESVASGYRYSLSSGYNERTLSMYERLGRVVKWRLRRFVSVIDADATETLMRATPSFATLAPAVRDVALERVRELAAVGAPPQPLDVEPSGRFDGDWDEAWEKMRLPYGFTTWRGSAFLNWRYIDCPFAIYKPYCAMRDGAAEGLIVLRVERASSCAVVRIVDLVGTPDAVKTLLAFARSAAREEGAVFTDYLVHGVTDGKMLADTGLDELDDPGGATLLPMDFNPLRHRNNILALATFLDPADFAVGETEGGQCYFTKGDGDQDRAN